MILLHKIGFQAKKEARKCPALYFGTMCKYFIYDKIIVYNAQGVSEEADVPGYNWENTKFCAKEV